jgi:hypothetical protein
MVSRSARTTILYVAIIAVTLCSLILVKLVPAHAAVSVTAVVLGICGNNEIEPLEQCDGTDLHSQTCGSLGYATGTLTCSASCSFNITQCINTNNGGGGGYTPPPPVDNAVILKGRAYPGATVTLLRNNDIFSTALADANARFELNVVNAPSGVYNLGIIATDSSGLRSTISNVLVYIASTGNTLVNGIFVSPTITVNKSEVKSGESILISGQSAPNADVFIVISSNRDFVVNAKAGDNGTWSYLFNTMNLVPGGYQVKALAELGNDRSPYSVPVSFIIGDKTIPTDPLNRCNGIADVDHNCRVDLVDYSIVAYWYDRPRPPANVDLNKDGIVSLPDFSILAYYWTGSI